MRYAVVIEKGELIFRHTFRICPVACRSEIRWKT